MTARAILLRPLEVAMCEEHGRARVELNVVEAHWGGFHDDGHKRIEHNQRACMAEYVISLLEGRPWDCPMYVQHPSEPDVPPDWQVRATTKPDGHLIVYRHDEPTHRFVLVVVQPPMCYVMGYILGRDAMRPVWWREPPAVRASSYWIPQDALTPWGLP